MSSRTVIGIDVGGTKSSLGLYDLASWKRLKRERFPTRREAGWPAVLEDVLRIAEGWKTPETVALGFGAPGLILQPEGMILRTPNIAGSEDFPLKETLERRLSIPAAVENDSNCFALGEAREGAGKGHSVVIGITMGTGVGGGIVVDGKIFHGAQGFAGEIGHMLLQPGDPPFETDDRRGDVEQFLSGTAMRKRCTEAESPKDLLEGDACAFLRPEIIREAAILCVNLTHLINPSIIIFGGGTGRALKPHLPAIEEEMTRWILPGTPLPQLSVAKLEDPATRGAALLAAENL